jgi:hypothetical protein
MYMGTKHPAIERLATKRPATKRPATKRPSGSYFTGPCKAILMKNIMCLKEKSANTYTLSVGGGGNMYST